MSTKQEVEKVISELRKKTQSVKYTEDKKKIDKKAAWELAKKIRKTLTTDDSLPASTSARA